MKQHFLRKSIFLITVISVMIQNAQAIIVYDPSNWVKNSLTAANSAKLLVEEIQQVKIALQNIKNYEGSQGQWADIQSLLQHLGDKVQEGQALAYTMKNLDSQFRLQFPGFTPSQDYQQAYSNWTKTTLDTLRGTLNSIGVQADQFSGEQATLQRLAYLSQSAEGRMQALQVGNMISTQQVAQLQQLRQLVMAQVNAENTYAAMQVQKEANHEAAVNQWIVNGDTQFPGYGVRR